MAFDASPSWSGFNYQGKVALYHALRLINLEPVDTDLSNYSLMLESTEDFEIQRDGTPISYHQVKAYNSSTYSDYSDALLGLILELYKQPGVSGKIHTWRRINFKPNFLDLTTSVKDDLNEILDEFKSQNPKDGSTVIEKAVSEETRIRKPASIIRAAFGNNTADELFELLSSITNGQNDALVRLQSYQYDDGNQFCDLNEINIKIKSEISNNLSARTIIVTPEKIEKTFYYFLGMIDRYIIERHKSKQKDEKIPITFSEIIQALSYDHEDIGREYLACKFKEKFAHLINEYMAEPDEYDEPEEDVCCNLKETRKQLLSLNPQALWEYYRNFSPHVYLQHENNLENALDIDFLGIRHVLIKIFHKINYERASHSPLKNKLTYRTATPPHQHYLPTTITNLARPSQIEREIKQNPSMSEILFEIEYLIYDKHELHRFSPILLNHTEAPIAMDADPRSKRDEVLRYITLVPIDVAKDKLA